MENKQNQGNNPSQGKNPQSERGNPSQQGGGNPSQQTGGNPSQGGNNPSQQMPGREGGGDQRTFRCADVGFADCRWEVSGRTEDEMMPKIEQHGREKHGMERLDDSTRNRVRDAIRTRAA